MCNRFKFDNLISLIGAWLLLILTFGIYYLVWSIYEYHYIAKHSIKTPYLHIVKEMLYELTPDYWWSC